MGKSIEARISICLNSKEQWDELKRVCKDNDMRLVKYGEDGFVYPVQCLITYIGSTGQPIICPTKDDMKECEERGWESVDFSVFKEKLLKKCS